MSDGGSEQDKSELPTPFKLERARSKGQVARGTDLGFLTGLSAFAGWYWMLGAGLDGRIAAATRNVLVAAPNVVVGPNELLAVAGQMMVAAARPLTFMAAAIFLIVLVFEIIQVGGVMFSAEPLRLDFSRLNPATGLKRLFSMRLLIETGKNLLKMGVYGALAWLAVRAAIGHIPAIVDAHSLLGAIRRSALALLASFLGAALVFAAFDQLIVRRDFTKRMRMSRREVKREHKDREGDPRLKQRRKQLHREYAAASQSVRGMRGADLLVTNPTHYAVGLRYDPATMEAPIVVARGHHHLAQRLKRLAFLYRVVTFPNPPLARALFRCDLDKPVPEALYQPVADLYRALRREASALPQD